MDEEIKQGQARKAVRGIKQAVQQSPGLRPSWTIAQTRAALYAHMTGNFTDSSQLVEAMMADDELPASLKKAVTLIVGAKHTMVPVTQQGSEKPEPNSALQAQAIDAPWSCICSQREMTKLVKWYLMLGVSVGELVWDTSGAPWKPTLRVLHPQFLDFDTSRINPITGDRGIFRFRTETGLEDVIPGDGRWVLLGDRDSFVNDCGVRAIASAWLSKQYSLRDWNRYNERHGIPVMKAHVPFAADDEDKADFIEGLANMGSETVALLPSGLDEHGTKFDLNLVEAMDQSWEAFKALIERCDRKMQVYFAGTNTNELLDSSGSRNTTQSGRDIAKERAAEREREISEYLREQIVKPYSKVNVPNADLSLAPMPHYKVMGDADSFKEAESAKALFESIAAAKAAGYKVNNAEKLAQELGLDIEVDEEAAARAKEAHDAAIAPPEVKEASKTPDSNRDTSRDEPHERTNGKRIEAG